MEEGKMSQTTERRRFLFLAGMAVAAMPLARFSEAWAHHGKIKKVEMSEKEWKDKLAPDQFRVLRGEGTERAFTSPLNKEYRKGTFVCAGCGLELFTSDMKYDSGTGWPSFFDAIPGHIETKIDYKIGVPRTEYHCARCGGHQGHVFEDGPQPTGLRYCNNGVALRFKLGE
ncbi:MAG: peptide-methionine (R)-S-oxide reductase MsrB [Alphaproteobacteria bacterium]|nr:peptide-methionine (R)-S-oxide reductase MsrB [Alphaproteobacteria bacterium]